MKQWAVKLTLDYGLADHAHKENQTLVNGKEVPFHPQSLHPRDPFPSPGGGENLCRQSCSWWHWGSRGILSLSLFLKSGASPSEELKPSRLQGGRIGHDGWWEMTPTESSPYPEGQGHAGGTALISPLKTYSHLILASLSTTTEQVWYLFENNYLYFLW